MLTRLFIHTNNWPWYKVNALNLNWQRNIFKFWNLFLLYFINFTFQKIWKELLDFNKTTESDLFFLPFTKTRVESVFTYKIQLMVLFNWNLYALPCEPFSILQSRVSYRKQRDACLNQNIVLANFTYILRVYCKQKKLKKMLGVRGWKAAEVFLMKAVLTNHAMFFCWFVAWFIRTASSKNTSDGLF